MRSSVPKSISADAAAALVSSGDWVDYGAVLSQPDVFDSALAQRASELHDVNIRGCLSLRPRAVLEADPGREHFNFFNWHFSGYDRKKCDAGLQHYIPCNLGEISDYYRRFIDPPDLMVVQDPPDGRGRVLQLRGQQPLARSDRIAGEGRHRRGEPGAALRARHRQRPARERGRLRDRRPRRTSARAAQLRAHATPTGPWRS